MQSEGMLYLHSDTKWLGFYSILNSVAKYLIFWNWVLLQLCNLLTKADKGVMLFVFTKPNKA